MVDLRDQRTFVDDRLSGTENVTVEELAGQGNKDHSRIGGCLARNERIQSGELKSLAVKKLRGKHNSSSVKIHPMITRGLKGNTDKGFKSKTRRVIWNLEVEITKVIEKRTAMGLYSDDIVPKAVNGGLLESKMGKEITNRSCVETRESRRVTTNRHLQPPIRHRRCPIMDGKASTQLKVTWKKMGDEERKVAVNDELKRMNQLPANSSYVIHRLRVLNKILQLISLQRTASQEEELELLFSGLSI
ncbi:hypothetical protein LWI28_024764 [Acer negundo]|uniref:Uncharacterized protein n=1 Tax=Acer negundo TaxID=4023 RepID=A0AAD5NMA5_ACENE|nr:hypothetical protein LWI28_024764 [Acer negundo]